MSDVIRVMYQEIAAERGNASSQYPKLKDSACDVVQEDEEKIARYLECAPNYSAMGKVVFDAFDRDNGKWLYPSNNTDGVYIWPTELAYYVRRYHVRLPAGFVQRMRDRDWEPPSEGDIDFENLDGRDA